MPDWQEKPFKIIWHPNGFSHDLSPQNITMFKQSQLAVSVTNLTFVVPQWSLLLKYMKTETIQGKPRACKSVKEAVVVGNGSLSLLFGFGLRF